jgi:hypothetical protein
MVIEKPLTKKQLAKRDRDLKIKLYYQNLPEGMRSLRDIGRVFGVCAGTVFYAVNGRKKK